MLKKIGILGVAMISGAVYAGDRLTGEDLQQFYQGKTLFVVHHKNGPTKSYFASDGSLRSLSDSGKERVGKWWIDTGKNLRCVRWNNKNKNFCHHTERNSDGTHTLVHSGNGKKLVEIKSTKEGDHL